MGLIDSLVRWIGRIVPGLAPGAESEPGTEEPDPAESEAGKPAYECAICGTPVDDPGEGCPLCGSTDIVPEGESRDPRDGEVLRGRGARETAVADEGASPTIDEVLGEGDLLSAYADRWERVGGDPGRYRVSLPDGEVTHAASKDEVRSLLFRRYGPPTEER